MIRCQLGYVHMAIERDRDREKVREKIEIFSDNEREIRKRQR